MANLVVINCIGLPEYALKELANGESALTGVLRFVKMLPSVDSVHCLVESNRSHPELLHDLAIHEAEPTPAGLLAGLAAVSAGRQEGDSLFYLFGDTPLLDPVLTTRMWENHRRYHADFTFADAYPVGLAPEILRVSAVAPLMRLAEGMSGKIERDTLFEVLRKDINAFEIETVIPPLDLRLLRIRLAAENRSGFMLLKRTINSGVSGADSLLHFLNDNQALLRTLPSYLSVQITGGCPQACSYCPYPTFGGDILTRRDSMSPKKFDEILQGYVDFSGGGYVNLAPWGEPALHPEIGSLIESILAYPTLKCVIETAGIGWPESLIDNLADKAEGRLTWIVSLDALKPETYRLLRGDGFDEAKRTAELLLQKFPETAFVQAVRMDTNEEELESFYRSWKEKTENIIIQKFDYFSGRFPQRRIADISPLKRNPCWHLKRDMVIMMDGSVPLCREDYELEQKLGNIFSDGFEKVWRRGEEFYNQHVSGVYPDICRECDEYYTFNF